MGILFKETASDIVLAVLESYEGAYTFESDI